MAVRVDVKVRLETCIQEVDGSNLCLDTDVYVVFVTHSLRVNAGLILRLGLDASSHVLSSSVLVRRPTLRRSVISLNIPTVRELGHIGLLRSHSSSCPFRGLPPFP
jgi:hypothetical protein